MGLLDQAPMRSRSSVRSRARRLLRADRQIPTRTAEASVRRRVRPTGGATSHPHCQASWIGRRRSGTGPAPPSTMPPASAMAAPSLPRSQRRHRGARRACPYACGEDWPPLPLPERRRDRDVDVMSSTAVGNFPTAARLVVPCTASPHRKGPHDRLQPRLLCPRPRAPPLHHPRRPPPRRTRRPRHSHQLPQLPCLPRLAPPQRPPPGLRAAAAPPNGTSPTSPAPTSTSTSPRPSMSGTTSTPPCGPSHSTGYWQVPPGNEDQFARVVAPLFRMGRFRKFEHLGHRPNSDTWTHPLACHTPPVTLYRWILSPLTSWYALRLARACGGLLELDVAWRMARMRLHPDELPFLLHGHGVGGIPPRE